MILVLLGRLFLFSRALGPLVLDIHGRVARLPRARQRRARRTPPREI
jgi:hypothetical protein